MTLSGKQLKNPYPSCFQSSFQTPVPIHLKLQIEFFKIYLQCIELCSMLPELSNLVTCGSWADRWDTGHSLVLKTTLPLPHPLSPRSGVGGGSSSGQIHVSTSQKETPWVLFTHVKIWRTIGSDENLRFYFRTPVRLAPSWYPIVRLTSPELPKVAKKLQDKSLQGWSSGKRNLQTSFLWLL